MVLKWLVGGGPQPPITLDQGGETDAGGFDGKIVGQKCICNVF